MIQKQRAPFIILALVSLIGALWAGLVRIGWSLPGAAQAPLAAHGPLMVVGFVGTVIGLERAVALNKKWAYVAPLLTGLGGLALLVAPSSQAGPMLMAAGSAAFLVVMGVLSRRQPGAVMVIMGLGAACWLIGNLLWLRGWQIFRVAPWWAVYPLLTIVAERLELSRFVKISRAAFSVFYAAVALALIGLVVGLLEAALGARLLAVSMLAMALWLLQYDVARKRLSEPGLPRFVAVGLLLGYLWLLVAGGTLLWVGFLTSGYAYDAVNHALFLGFVFSMIFVHAPIIFPSITGVNFPFLRIFYVHLALLHASLLLRIAGDARLWLPWRQWGALGNAAAIVLFFLVTIGTVISTVIASKRQQAT